MKKVIDLVYPIQGGHIYFVFTPEGLGGLRGNLPPELSGCIKRRVATLRVTEQGETLEYHLYFYEAQNRQRNRDERWQPLLSGSDVEHCDCSGLPVDRLIPLEGVVLPILFRMEFDQWKWKLPTEIPTTQALSLAAA